jgi:hypothetical protein
MPAEEQPQQSAQFNYEKDRDFRSVYANNTIFASTAFDFSMTFAEIMEVDPAGAHIKAEQRVKVVMSPLHFKIFAAVCAQNVALYEARFGTIQLPDGGTGGIVANRPDAAATEAIAEGLKMTPDKTP